MSKEDKEFIETIDQEYYKRITNSEDYYKRKKLILLNLDRLQKKIEKNAKHFDDYERLRYIMLEKARQKKSILKKFIKLEQFTKEQEEKEFNKGNEEENQ